MFVLCYQMSVIKNLLADLLQVIHFRFSLKLAYETSTWQAILIQSFSPFQSNGSFGRDGACIDSTLGSPQCQVHLQYTDNKSCASMNSTSIPKRGENWIGLNVDVIWANILMLIGHAK